MFLVYELFLFIYIKSKSAFPSLGHIVEDQLLWTFYGEREYGFFTTAKQEKITIFFLLFFLLNKSTADTSDRVTKCYRSMAGTSNFGCDNFL